MQPEVLCVLVMRMHTPSANHTGLGMQCVALPSMRDCPRNAVLLPERVSARGVVCFPEGAPLLAASAAARLSLQLRDAPFVEAFEIALATVPFQKRKTVARRANYLYSKTLSAPDPLRFTSRINGSSLPQDLPQLRTCTERTRRRSSSGPSDRRSA